MNARQKAKLYKKRLETIQDMLNPKIPQIISGNISKIETVSVVLMWDDRTPFEFIKNDITKEFVKRLIDNNCIYFKIDEQYDNFTMCRKVKGTMKVCTEWWKENENENK